MHDNNMIEIYITRHMSFKYGIPSFGVRVMYFCLKLYNLHCWPYYNNCVLINIETFYQKLNKIISRYGFACNFHVTIPIFL